MLSQAAVFDRARPVAGLTSTRAAADSAYLGALTGTGEAARADAANAASFDTALALALFRHMVQPAILMDPDGRVTMINAAAGRLIMPPSRGTPCAGRFWWEIWPHADRGALRDALDRAAGGEAVTITLDCRRAVASSAMLLPLEAGTGSVAKLLCLLRAG